jgi:hypothetical protein
MNMVQEFALNLIVISMLVGAFVYGLYQLTLWNIYEEGGDDGNKLPKSEPNESNK